MHDEGAGHRSVGSVVRARWASLAVALFMLALGTTPSAQAAGPEEVFRGGETVVVRGGQTVPHDLFLGAQSVVIDGTVQGDVMVGANTVTVNGAIEGDLWAAANTVLVNGQVRGDVRAGANSLIVSGEVGRNVLAATNSAVVSDRGRIGGDLMSFSARTEVAGQVRGDVSGQTAEYQRTGTIGGRELIQVAPREQRPQRAQETGIGQWLADRVRHWLGVVLIGALLLLIWRSGALNLATTIARRPLASLGSGLLVVVGSVVGLILALVVMVLLALLFGALQLGGLTAIVIIGTILAEAVTVLGLVLTGVFVAGGLIGLLVGRFLLEGRVRSGGFDVWLWLLLGTVLYVIVAGLPTIGPLVQVVAALLALGALGLGTWGALRRPRVVAEQA